MGTDVHLLAVDAGPGALEHAQHRIEELERMWSRFIPDSEISLANGSAGEPVPVSSETLLLVRRAIDGWRATGGLFDPTVLRALTAAGYDRTFERVPARAVPVAYEAGPAPGCDELDVDETWGTITIPHGVGFDPGGIGKGLAADIVTEELLEDGRATGVCVNIGGDLRAAGRGPDGGPWVVAIEDPYDGTAIGRIALDDGAIATSSRVRRAWRNGDRDSHHLIDPATGLPVDSSVLSATVVAGRGWWAEVLSKAAFLAPPNESAALLELHGTPALVTFETGGMLALAGMEDRLW
jgi:FAD:protein FMN transferase